MNTLYIAFIIVLLSLGYSPAIAQETAPEISAETTLTPAAPVEITQTETPTAEPLPEAISNAAPETTEVITPTRLEAPTIIKSKSTEEQKKEMAKRKADLLREKKLKELAEQRKLTEKRNKERAKILEQKQAKDRLEAMEKARKKRIQDLLRNQRARNQKSRRDQNH